MNKFIAAAVVAMTVAGLSFGASAATVVTKTTVTKTAVHHPAHWGMHQVCKVSFHNHHRVKVCTWVKNK